MDGIARLNQLPGRVALGDGAGAEVLHWAYSPHLPDNVPHRHAYFEVCLVGEYGSGLYRVGEAIHSLGPGDLFIARPGIVHQIRNLGVPLMELSWVAFALAPGRSDSAVGALLRRFAGADRAVIPGAKPIAAVWRALRETAEADAPEAQMAALMAALLLGIAHAGAEESDGPTETFSPDDLARRAVRYIHEHLDRTLGVEEVAAQLAVSPRHLTRRIVRFTGIAPAAYIERARMHRAAALLVRTDDPIKQVAALVGYGDVHHFTRAFRRVHGCPPGRYRASAGGAGRQIVLSEETAGKLV